MKKHMKILSVVSLSLTVGLLSSCSGNKHSMAGDGSADAAANYKTAASDNGATAYAIAKNTAYKKDSAGFKVNAITAPANQTYYFAFDSNKVRSQDMRALLVQANYLASHSAAKVRLEGNTDDRGSREYNIGLGWRRNQAVARILEQEGVRPGQIQMVSYGEQNPVVMGSNEKAWSLNRRVEMIYKK